MSTAAIIRILRHWCCCLPMGEEGISPLLTEEAMEEHQEHNLPLPPTDSVYILPSPASQSQPKTLAAEAKAIPHLLPIQYFKKLVAFLFKHFLLHRRHWQLLTPHGIADGLGAGSDMEHLDLGISASSTSFSSLQRLKRLV